MKVKAYVPGGFLVVSDGNLRDQRSRFEVNQRDDGLLDVWRHGSEARRVTAGELAGLLAELADPGPNQ